MNLDYRPYLTKILPGQDVDLIQGFPSFNSTDSLIRQINRCKKSKIVLTTGDPWAKNKDQSLIDFLTNDDRTFYILTLEYNNYWLAENIAVLSFPAFYFTRNIIQLQIKARKNRPAVSCLNRMPRAHRLLLGIHLHQANLLDKIIWSQDTLDYENAFTGDARNLIEQMDFDQSYRRRLPIYHNEIKSTNDHTVDHVAYTKSYCNIVTETEIEYFYHDRLEPLPGITEKSYKPFLSGQLPIFFASPGHYAYLRRMGFEPMEDLVGEIDHMGCLDKCIAIRDTLARGDDFFEDFYFSNLDKIEYNHQLIVSDKLDNKIINDIKIFLDQ